MEGNFRISWIIFAVTLAATPVAFSVMAGRPWVILWVPVSMLIGLGAAYASHRANPDMRITQFRDVVLVGSTTAKALIVALIITASLNPLLKSLVTKEIFAIAGLLIIVAGNYLPKTARSDASELPFPWNWLFSIPWALPLSYMFGVRTWWTLRSDHVWNRTQRFAGRLWMLGGLGYFITPWLFAGPAMTKFMLTDLAAMIMLPILYSWWISSSDYHDGMVGIGETAASDDSFLDFLFLLPRRPSKNSAG